MARGRKRRYKKVCKDCGIEFISTSRNTQYCPECKVARKKEATRKWYADNSEKKKEYYRKWYAENPEKQKEANRKWRAENPEKKKESNRKFKYKRLLYLADNYNSYDELSEKDKRFVDSQNDTLRIKETNLQYGRLKPNKTGYQRHHIIPYLTCIHYWELTGDDYYLKLTYDDDNIVQLTPEAHSKLHSKLYEFGYGSKAIVPEEDWDEYKELVYDLINDKSQTSLFDF